LKPRSAVRGPTVVLKENVRARLDDRAVEQLRQQRR
jgi:hypothetical protein